MREAAPMANARCMEQGCWPTAFFRASRSICAAPRLLKHKMLELAPKGWWTPIGFDILRTAHP